ncbi:MAG: hypothetical protein HC817_09920 [Saprospiraceae bacterium]|nr:hypothetical protein [Saprospiraceae bacterium]
MKTILATLLMLCVQATIFSQNATLDFTNKTVSGNDITFEVTLNPETGTTIYLGNFDVTINLPTQSVTAAARIVRTNINSEDATPVPISTFYFCRR